MLTGYEQRLIVHYLANLASCLHHRDQEAKSVVSGIPGAVQYRQVSKSDLRVVRANRSGTRLRPRFPHHERRRAS